MERINNKQTLIIGLMVGLLISPAQSLNAKMPEWLLNHGPKIGLALLGAATSYGVSAVISKQELRREQNAAQKPLAAKISWSKATKLLQQKKALYEEWTQKNNVYGQRYGYGPKNYVSLEQQTMTNELNNLHYQINHLQETIEEKYIAHITPQALGKVDYERFIKEKNDTKVFATKASAALITLGFSCITGIMAYGLNQKTLPFFGAVGGTALWNWYMHSQGVAKSASQTKKWSDEMIGKYCNDAQTRQAEFASALSDNNKLNKIKDLLENHDVDWNAHITITTQDRREISMTPLVYAVMSQKDELKKILLEQEKHRIEQTDELNIEYASIGAREGHLDAISYCAERGDKAAIEQILQIPNRYGIFRDSREGAKLCKKAFHTALQHKQYHLLELLDLSDDKQEARKVFRPFIVNRSSLADADLKKLLENPLFRTLCDEAYARQKQFVQLINNNDLKTMEELFTNYDDVDINSPLSFSYTYKGQEIGPVVTTPLMNATLSEKNEFKALLLKQPTICFKVAIAQDAIDVITYCAMIGDKTALSCLMSLPHFRDHKENLECCQKALSMALQRKEYGLLHLLDTSKDRSESRKAFAEVIANLSSYKEESINQFLQDPLFVEMIRNNDALKTSVSLLLEYHLPQDACAEFMSNRLDWGSAASAIFKIVLSIVQAQKAAQKDSDAKVDAID